MGVSSILVPHEMNQNDQNTEVNVRIISPQLCNNNHFISEKKSIHHLDNDHSTNRKRFPLKNSYHQYGLPRLSFFVSALFHCNNMHYMDGIVS